MYKCKYCDGFGIKHQEECEHCEGEGCFYPESFDADLSEHDGGRLSDAEGNL